MYIYAFDEWNQILGSLIYTQPDSENRDRIGSLSFQTYFVLEVGSWPFAFFLYVNLSLRNEKRETRLSSLLNPSFRFINRLVNINNLN
jgi:hypothetical protein